MMREVESAGREIGRRGGAGEGEGESENQKWEWCGAKGRGREKKMSPSRECESGRGTVLSGWRNQTAPHHRGGYYRSWGIVTLRVRPCAYGIRTSVTATVCAMAREAHPPPSLPSSLPPPSSAATLPSPCRLHRLSLTSNVRSRNTNLRRNNGLSDRPARRHKFLDR